MHDDGVADDERCVYVRTYVNPTRLVCRRQASHLLIRVQNTRKSEECSLLSTSLSLATRR